ncbi:MAG: FAD:protein FMN transferase [Nitrososphaerota archaeon]
MFSIRKSTFSMGTIVTITLVHEDIGYAKRIIDEAFSELKRIERIMSIYDEESEVNKLNKEGFLEHASDELIYILKEAIRISKLTRGVYDVTILPLIEYIVRKRGELDEEELERILELVDYSLIEISGKSIRFLKKGMKIVLNSVAKGYAVDLASEYLIKHGVKHALINAGGDLKAVGEKTDGEPWRIAIRNPFEKDKSICKLMIYSSSVATSGNYERRIGSGNFSHILNPYLKNSLSSQVVSATVITERALIADALATSLCAMNPSESIHLIEELGEAEAMIITNNRDIIKTRNFRIYEGD